MRDFRCIVGALTRGRASGPFACAVAVFAVVGLVHAQRSGADGAWSSAPPLLHARAAHAVVASPDAIYALAGTGARGRPVLDVERFDGTRWSVETTLPGAGLHAGSPAGVVHAGSIHAIGGRSGPADFGDVYVFDAARNAWSRGPAIDPRGTAGAVDYCAEIHLFGGESQSRTASLATAERLDDKLQRWIALPPMPTARNFARAVTFRGAVLVVGGSPDAGNSHRSSGSAVVERYQRDC